MGLPDINELRKQLREKFPAAHLMLPDRVAVTDNDRPFQVDEFPLGKVSEVVPTDPSCGLILLVAGLLGEPHELSPHPELVLVDGADAFDPGSYTGAACSKMLWVRCSSALEMIRAADLLVNDGNVPLVLLDATGLGRQELLALPAAAWWRLSRTLEKTGGRLVVMTPTPMVPCASRRLFLSASLTLKDFDNSREDLVHRLQTTTPEGRRQVT